MSKGLTLLAGRLLEAEQQAAMALAKAQQDLKLFMDQQNALNQYRQIYHPFSQCYASTRLRIVFFTKNAIRQVF